MKNTYLIMAVALILGIASCSTLKQGSKDQGKGKAISKERMKTDAYAMANIECEYRFVVLKLEDNKNDRKLKSQFAEIQTNMATFTKVVNTRYRTSNDLSMEFNKMVKSAAKELTTCQQLQAFEESREEEKAEVKEKE